MPKINLPIIMIHTFIAVNPNAKISYPTAIKRQKIMVINLSPYLSVKIPPKRGIIQLGKL